MHKYFIFVFFLIFSTTEIAFSQTEGLEIGNKAPEISLPSPKGELISLYAQKGKLVLIDFWGTWCAPCVAEQSELSLLYNKYNRSKFKNGNQFEIFGVSLDAKKVNWENSIASLKINWIQVSDLKFWRSPVAKTYNIQALPFNVLIDGQGIILAKNLHGKDLEDEIAKQLLK